MVDIPTKEPVSFVAGNTVEWKKTFSDYPSPTWVLSYVLHNGTDKITITATASSGDHLVSLSASATAAYIAGEYKYQAYLTNGSDRRDAGAGTITIKPDFAQAGQLDNRTHARIVLDALDAMIEGRATKDQQSYSIGNRQLTRMPIEDLIKWQNHYKLSLIHI